MSNVNGWICLHRTIQKHWIWEDSERLKAWLDLLMLANYEDKKVPYKGEMAICKRGSVNLSIEKLAEHWGWSRARVKRFLVLLERDDMVSCDITKHRTVITIKNYDKYQNNVTTNNTTESIENTDFLKTDTSSSITTSVITNIQQESDQSATTEQQTDITNNKNNNKKKNNNNNNNNISLVAPKKEGFNKPTLQEIKDYIEDQNLQMNAEEFFHYYDSIGWMRGDARISNWKSAASLWAIRSPKPDRTDNKYLDDADDLLPFF